MQVNPFKLSFTVSNSWLRQSDVFVKSVSEAPNDLILSAEFFQFSKRFKYCVLYPFLKPHCCSDRKLPKKPDSNKETLIKKP